MNRPDLCKGYRRQKAIPRLARVVLLAIPLLLTACGGSTSASSSPSAAININNSAPAPIASARTVSISWNAPTVRIDNAPVVPSEIGGYRIYYGSDSNNLQLLTEITDPGRTNFTTAELTPGSYYFAVTAYDVYGTESQYSNIDNKVVL